MKTEKKEYINKNMEDVIETSKKMRDFLLDKTIPNEEKSKEMINIKHSISANKSIVSASIVLISVDKLNEI